MPRGAGVKTPEPHEPYVAWRLTIFRTASIIQPRG